METTEATFKSFMVNQENERKIREISMLREIVFIKEDIHGESRLLHRYPT
jgi:hypothetical protein